VGGGLCFNRGMNLASFLLCLVFAGVGYVAYPIILPKLIDAKLVSEASLSDDYKVDVTEKADGDEVASEEGGEGGAVVSGDDVRKPVVPMLPDEVERPAKPSKPQWHLRFLFLISSLLRF